VGLRDPPSRQQINRATARQGCREWRRERAQRREPGARLRAEGASARSRR